MDERGVLPFKGGETAARVRVHHYLWQSNLVATYKDTRNGLVGGALCGHAFNRFPAAAARPSLTLRTPRADRGLLDKILAVAGARLCYIALHLPRGAPAGPIFLCDRASWVGQTF